MSTHEHRWEMCVCGEFRDLSEGAAPEPICPVSKHRADNTPNRCTLPWLHKGDHSFEDESPFQRVVDDLTEGDGCACHTGIGYNSACRHCQPQMYGTPDVRIDDVTLVEEDGGWYALRVHADRADLAAIGYALVEYERLVPRPSEPVIPETDALRPSGSDPVAGTHTTGLDVEAIVRQTLAIVDRTTPLSVGEPLVQRVLARLSEANK